ncbi:MAG: NAD(P)/FAD-dependent oxidoreductase [Candidatus Bathyarchaeia archaeon]|nr:NAD(P)/FAD-dependent oxidoreductase [Candidatus Bathyarchaeota archaeon]
MENFSDIIVVGAGPSGSFCALNIAKEGIKVTVFEEHNEIGTPCHCAGHLSIIGLKNLGLYPLPKGIVENTFHGAKIYSPRGSEFSVHFPSPITCTVDRASFDKHISRLAEKAGARYFLGSRVNSLTFRENCIETSVSKISGERFNFSGKIVVDAEGVNYRILKQAGLNPPKNDFVYCVNAEIENVKNIELDMVEVFLGNDYAPGFYAWLIPKEEGKAKVGLGVKIGNPKNALRKLMQKHPAASEKLKNAKILREIFHSIPLSGPIKRAYCNRFLAVGDAASQVKPTTGGGVILGLNCAKIAAEVAVEAVNLRNFSSKFLSKYQRRLIKLLGFDMKIMSTARKMLNRISDEKLNDLIKTCRKFFDEEDFQDFCDIDFQGRMFVKALRKPKIAVAIAYFALLSLEAFK